jgi:predicted permease
MNLLRSIFRRICSIVQRRAAKQEIDEELRFHIDQRTAENIAAGMSPEEAEREARKRFGNLHTAREECRRLVGASFGESVLRDIHFGWRMLWKNLGFTTVGILTLALGVGGTTAIYSAVKSVVLEPIPGPQPDRLVQIAERTFTQGLFKDQNNKLSLVGVSHAVLEALVAQRNFFANLVWSDDTTLARETSDFSEMVSARLVPTDYFAVWKIQPFLGRTFAPDEAILLDDQMKTASDCAIVLSYSLWQSKYGGDRNLIGRTIKLSNRHFTVIGVMPPWFLPEGSNPVLWVPVQLRREDPNSSSLPNTRVIARLKPETSQKQAQAMLDAMAARLSKEHEHDNQNQVWHDGRNGLSLAIRTLSAQFQGSYGSEDLRRTLFELLGAIFFVLLIICANIANLTLARTERRQQEMAIRTSIGAGRGRLMRQLLTESLLLSCLGGLAGVAVSVWGMKILLSLVPDSVPRLKPVQLDIHVLACSLTISIVTSLLFGLVPAWRAGRTQMGEALKQAGIGATPGARGSRYRGTLVVAEVALAVVLLAGAGLMIKSVIRMLHVDPGFDPENLVGVKLSIPMKYERFGNPKEAVALRHVLYAHLLEQMKALPGVRAVGIGKHGAWPLKLKAEGRNQEWELLGEGCSLGPSDLFQAMRIPLLAGRVFDERDLGLDSASTAIVNETMARMLWPGEPALGKKFGGMTILGERSFEVVGVVGDYRDGGYNQQLRPAFYRPCEEWSLEGWGPFLVIRTQTDPRSLIPAVRRELRAAEPEMGSPRITIETQQLYDSTQAQRTYMLYLVVFAGVGVMLCAIGIYGVLAYSVARRVREIGIRIAVGAQRGDVLWMVMMEGLRLVVIGAGVGLLAAYWLTRLLRNQLFEVNPADPTVMAAVILFLFAVALLACYLPARHAARTNPMTALRYE